MSIKSYWEEFNTKFNQPEISNITVGFSGIDPCSKSSGSLSEAQIKGIVLNFLSGINEVDFGEIN